MSGKAKLGAGIIKIELKVNLKDHLFSQGLETNYTLVKIIHIFKIIHSLFSLIHNQLKSYFQTGG